jgi:DNA polymerase-1
MSKDERPILLVDGMNVFMRAYCVYPQMSKHGHQVGGVVGFLKTLRKVVNEQKPKAIYVAWESGGSARRRGLFSDYKANRKPEKLNRFYEDDIPDTTENKEKQVSILAKMLKCLPVQQVYIADCEGDDVIAYLTRYRFQDENKVIVSSDKDFYQLVNDRTKVYNLHKKCIVTKEDVLAETHIATHNFALAKAICGDTSDNIPGIEGVGFKTLTKRYPFFGTEQELTLDDVIGYSTTHQKSSSVYRKVLVGLDVIRRNWQLVYLDSSSIAPSQIERIDFILGTFKPSVNKIAFIKHLIAEGISDFEVDNFFFTFIVVGASN